MDENDVLVLNSLPAQLSVLALVSGVPGSVRFGLDGNPSFRTGGGVQVIKFVVVSTDE